jgi:hypothetical protein
VPNDARARTTLNFCDVSKGDEVGDIVCDNKVRLEGNGVGHNTGVPSQAEPLVLKEKAAP